jgi:hypothetical protein
MWQKRLSYHLTVLREGINSLQLSLPTRFPPQSMITG